jgi:hypothetical protein
MGRHPFRENADPLPSQSPEAHEELFREGVFIQEREGHGGREMLPASMQRGESPRSERPRRAIASDPGEQLGELLGVAGSTGRRWSAGLRP